MAARVGTSGAVTAKGEARARSSGGLAAKWVERKPKWRWKPKHAQRRLLGGGKSSSKGGGWRRRGQGRCRAGRSGASRTSRAAGWSKAGQQERCDRAGVSLERENHRLTEG